MTLDLRCCVVGRVHLAVIVTTTAKIPDVVVGPVFNKLCGLWIATKEVFAHEGAVFCLEGLEITVNGLVHQVHKSAFAVLAQEFIPLATPYNLDDIPACAAEE